VTPARPMAGWSHERELSRRYRVIAGVDEVGRGSLAGPVLAAAVVLDADHPIAGLRDSKLLTSRARARLAGEIARCAVCCAVGMVDPEEIDRTDILRATLVAMRRAVMALRTRPEVLLVDALTIPGVGLPQRSIVRGDQISASIAAASIVAKVYRDAMMRAFHAAYPLYRFDANKGYGTADHLQALHLHGPTPLHRTTFRGVPAPGGPPRETGARSL
jgi:ribonuclease HII